MNLLAIIFRRENFSTIWKVWLNRASHPSKQVTGYMRLLLLFLVFVLAVAALAIWLLPWWASVPLLVVFGLPTIWIVWKIRSFIKKLKKRLEGVMPQEKLCSLAANEPFNGKGFSFVFPVPCEVSQTTAVGCEALILRPKLEFDNAPKDTLLIVASFPREEIKAKLAARLSQIYAHVPALQLGEFVPVQVGALTGERQTIQASHEGKDLRGESVFLGGADFTIAWFAFGPVQTFDAIAAKYRELSSCIQKTAMADSSAT